MKASPKISTATRGTRVYQMRDLQSRAPTVVRRTAAGAVEIRRFTETVAYLESPEEHRRHEALDRAAARALVAFDVERALRDAAADRTSEWDEVVERLRTELA